LKKKILVTTGVVVGIALSSSFLFADAFFGGFDKVKKLTKSEQPTRDVALNNESPQDLPEEVTKDPQADQELMKSISYYNESKTKKEEIQSNNQAAIKKVKERAAKDKAPVKPDLDNQQYRDYIKGMATDLASLSPAERQQIIALAKQVDAYENKLKNQQIKQLVQKAKTEGLTLAERNLLRDLLPTKDKGVKLQPGTAKPEPNTNNEQQQQQPAQDEQQNNQQTPEDQEGTRQGQEPSQNQEQPQTDADQTTGDQPSAEQPQGDLPSTDPNQPEEQPAQDEQQPADQDEQQPAEKQQQEQNIVQAQETMKEANGYDRAKARDYAYQWWNKRNNTQYPYYSKANGSCYNCWYDCTNFVSQAMYAGGLKQWKSGPSYLYYWYYYNQPKKPSNSWGLANSLFKHMKVRAKQAESMSELKVGDIVQGDLDNDGDIDHTAIVTKIENGQVYVTQHTTDRKDHPLALWFAAGYDVYAWKMGTASNITRN
jgi:hypothetical protein